MAAVFPESRVIQFWQKGLVGRTDLVTEEGEPIQVISPGFRNDNRGADLRDATLMTGRGLMRGDVEVHVRSSSWWGHGHDRDPEYNRVVLHVVYWHDAGAAASLQNGRSVPTLALHRFVDSAALEPSPAGSPAPCNSAIHPEKSVDILSHLEAAGDARFSARATEFRKSSVRAGAGQALYGGIMSALGYSKNKKSMEELACRVPLEQLESMTAAELSDTGYLARVQATLLGTAGLLPSGRYPGGGTSCHDPWIEELESLWASLPQGRTMSEDDWRFFKVRPGNFPTRRIAAMSYLLLRYKDAGLLRGLMSKISEAPPGTDLLTRTLLVDAGAYRAGSPSLIGRGRAGDIIVNALLPFTAAWAQLNQQPDLAEKAAQIYRLYPPLAVNSIEKYMQKQLGINQTGVRSARQQQGLLHIYKTYCATGNCPGCPVKSTPAGAALSH